MKTKIIGSIVYALWTAMLMDTFAALAGLFLIANALG
jgi:hypothetical protein